MNSQFRSDFFLLKEFQKKIFLFQDFGISALWMGDHGDTATPQSCYKDEISEGIYIEVLRRVSGT